VSIARRDARTGRTGDTDAAQTAARGRREPSADSREKANIAAHAEKNPHAASDVE
jgi:hypothetical protein